VYQVQTEKAEGWDCRLFPLIALGNARVPGVRTCSTFSTFLCSFFYIVCVYGHSIQPLPGCSSLLYSLLPNQIHVYFPPVQIWGAPQIQSPATSEPMPDPVTKVMNRSNLRATTTLRPPCSHPLSSSAPIDPPFPSTHLIFRHCSYKTDARQAL